MRPQIKSKKNGTPSPLDGYLLAGLQALMCPVASSATLAGAYSQFFHIKNNSLEFFGGSAAFWQGLPFWLNKVFNILLIFGGSSAYRVPEHK